MCQLAREVEELRQFPEELFAVRFSTTIPVTGSTVHETDEEIQEKKLCEEHFRLFRNNPNAFWEGMLPWQRDWRPSQGALRDKIAS
jgi:hypothetical protein